MATIYDIAKACGLSPATVSKALSNASDVSAATRERVRRIAQELDYVPNAGARALSQSRTWSIGVLCQDASQMGLWHYLFAQVIESFKDYVEQHGYDIVFISNKVGNMGLSYLGHCRYRRVDGVFIVNTDHSQKDARELIESNLPKIAIDFENKSIGCVMTDPCESMRLLFSHLYDQGHRNIVYLHGERGKFITEERISALEKAAADASDKSVNLRLFPSRYYSIEGGYDSMKKLLEATPDDRPTAVIASDDYSAIGVISAIRDAGLSVPDDISVVGFDGIEITQRTSPNLTTIRQDTKAIGEAAAQNLLAQIAGEENVQKTISLKPQLVLGESCTTVNK
ncbi:MAG: LacI family DNA-binding transcriptional regulator [Clostridiales bacterium]|nr:LacI family DNA-binding transcriptional regulator [Clostridiales bacterium]